MKVSTPRKLPSGSYFIQLRLDGKSVSVTAATAKECKHKAELIKAEHFNDKRIMPDKSTRTLSEAIDRYIEERSAVLSPSTIQGYRVVQHNRFTKVMNKQLKSIKNWQAIVNEESKLVSGKTVHNAWGLVSTVMRSEGMNVPEVHLPQKVVKERRWLDVDEVKLFLEKVQGDDVEVATILGLHSLRFSEALALDVSDIDSEYIHVRGAVVRGENGLIKKETNKNSSSRRDIPILIPRLLEVLPQNGPAVTIAHNTVNRHIKKICEENDLPVVTFHELRHSFVALCVSKNIPVDVVQKIGGWDDYATLKNVYTHISDKTVKNYAEQLKNIFC